MTARLLAGLPGPHHLPPGLLGALVPALTLLLALDAYFDARPGLSMFLRTRVSSSWQLVTPRFAVCAVGAAAAYLLGTIAAWIQVRSLLGSLPAAGLLGGMLCGVTYLTFAVAVTALAASVTRGTLATSGVAFAVLLALPILGTIHAIERWLPSALVNAPVDLADGAHQLPYFGSALGVTVVASGAALCAAVIRLRAREI